MFRIVLFAIVLSCGTVLVFVGENAGSRAAGGLICVSAAAGLVWAFRDYRKKKNGPRQADKLTVPGAGIALLQIVSSAGITVSGIGTVFVAASRWLTIVGWTMAIGGAVATLLALKAYRDRPHS